MGETDCIFCKIVSGDAPAYKVFENDEVVAFLDIFPWAKGHTLVVPKGHSPNIFEISEADAAAVIRAVRKIAPVLRDTVEAEGMNLLQSNGRAGWQTVDHFHMHLIPRWADDSLVPPGESAPGDRAAIEAMAQEVAHQLSGR